MLKKFGGLILVLATIVFAVSTMMVGFRMNRQLKADQHVIAVQVDGVAMCEWKPIASGSRIGTVKVRLKDHQYQGKPDCSGDTDVAIVFGHTAAGQSLKCWREPSVARYIVNHEVVGETKNVLACE